MNSNHLMKKFVFVLVLLGSLTGSAQSMDKLLGKAFGRGADTNGVYTLENTKGAFITESDAVSYLREQKGYVVLSSNSKTCSRFGYEEQVFDKIFFLNGKEGYEKYNHCNARGTLYHPTAERSFFSWDFNKITSRMDDVPWSGKIVNGLLDGEGIGVLNFANGWCAIKCKFQCGIPVSKPEIIYSFPSNFNYSSKFPFPKDYEDKYEMRSMLIQTYDNTTDPTLRWAVSENLKVYFEKEVRNVVEPEFNKALTLNGLKNMGYGERRDTIWELKKTQKMKEGLHFRGDDYYTTYTRLEDAIETLNKILDRYGNKISDSEWIYKAKEIIYAYQLAEYYYAVVLPKQRHSSLLITNIAVYWTDWPWLIPHFDNTAIQDCIDNLNSVKEKIHEQSSPFYDFYNAIYPDIQANEEWINNELEDYLINDWKRIKSEWSKDEAEKMRNYNANMCEKCKINGKESTIPQGYEPGDDSWLFGHPARSKEKGKIVFQNGDISQWRYIYEGGETTIEVSGGWYDGKYKNEKEMWDGLIRQCKEKYCR